MGMNLDRLLKYLTPEQRDVVRLRRKGMSYGEISLVLGITKQSAHGRFQRAKSRIKRLKLV